MDRRSALDPREGREDLTRSQLVEWAMRTLSVGLAVRLPNDSSIVSRQIQVQKGVSCTIVPCQSGSILASSNMV